jgi:hypothetical protein
MLKWMYTHFSLVGSVFLFAFCFFCFVLWLAGIAGLNERNSEQNHETPAIKLFLFIAFPPVPIIWILKDMWYQRKMMKSD